MIKFFRKIIVALVFTAGALVAHPFVANAAILQPTYSLVSPIVGSSFNGQTGFVTISGMVTAVQGQQPQNASLKFKTNIVGQTAVTEHPAFSPLASGSFDPTLSGFTCGQTYRFFLYEMPDPNTPGSVESLINWGNSVGFDYVMSCGSSQANGGDVLTTVPNAEVISGVNWGNIVSTDTSITISNAHLIPFLPAPPQVSYKIEYGVGGPGQSNAYYEYLGNVGGLSTANQPNYSFSKVITGLTPNTYYNFTVVEVVNGVERNLFTYGFAPTNLLTGIGLQRNFPNATTFRVFGALTSSNGNVFYNTPIQIVIKNSDGQTLMTNNTVTGAQSQFGSGYFESVFNNITSYGLVAGQTYTYTIMSPAPGGAFALTTPQSFTVPTPYSPTTATVTDTPTYDGLVACGANPELYDCDFNTFLETINRVVNFLIMFVAFPCVALVVAWAGILLLTSGGSAGAKEKAKSMIGKVIVGLIVALLAWVIIKLVLVVFGYTADGPLWQILGTTP